MKTFLFLLIVLTSLWIVLHPIPKIPPKNQSALQFTLPSGWDFVDSSNSIIKIEKSGEGFSPTVVVNYSRVNLSIDVVNGARSTIPSLEIIEMNKDSIKAVYQNKNNKYRLYQRYLPTKDGFYVFTANYTEQDEESEIFQILDLTSRQLTMLQNLSI